METQEQDELQESSARENGWDLEDDLEWLSLFYFNLSTNSKVEAKCQETKESAGGQQHGGEEADDDLLCQGSLLFGLGDLIASHTRRGYMTK